MSAPLQRPHPSRDAPREACLVSGCGGEAVRHLSLSEARKVFPNLPAKGRKAPLCREHYKEWKKATKAARTLDRLAW
jgi:hypothetical protein